MIENKPLNEISDSELKCRGYDLMTTIETLQGQLSIIRDEFTRRRSSNVLSSMTYENFQNSLNKTE